MTTQTLTYQNAKAASTSKPRLLYIDNLRILMTALVILLHLSIGYGAPGDWYYNEEGTLGTVSGIVMTLFVALNQAFFMGFFFMLSSYFSPGSLERKGSRPFISDRLKRLGIPLVVYTVIVNPLLNFVLNMFSGRVNNFTEFMQDHFVRSIGVGPMWFVETLLIFAGLYVLWTRFVPARPVSADSGAPGNIAIVLFAAALGVATFIVRIWLPVGWWLEPVHFQLAHFPQYIALYILGIVAYKRNWFAKLTDRQGKVWAWVVVSLIVVFPIVFVVGGALEGNLEPFIGGLHWQSLVYSVWEQLMCVAMIVTLLIWFRNRVNQQGDVAQVMSRGAYATYIFHAPIIVLIALALSSISMDLALKYVVVAPIAVIGSFLVGYIIKQMPYARSIL